MLLINFRDGAEVVWTAAVRTMGELMLDEWMPRAYGEFETTCVGYGAQPPVAVHGVIAVTSSAAYNS